MTSLKDTFSDTLAYSPRQLRDREVLTRSLADDFFATDSPSAKRRLAIQSLIAWINVLILFDYALRIPIRWDHGVILGGGCVILGLTYLLIHQRNLTYRFGIYALIILGSLAGFDLCGWSLFWGLLVGCNGIVLFFMLWLETIIFQEHQYIRRVFKKDHWEIPRFS